ncbi:DgyrCDS8696 [Dimorphilus gyrociliatus]|uniref:DgyrCDS8696 n=1 Tax=Dimorphilus gyrociliatus TaxID=2664684 RepID=A0A7I8VWD6_9ANNE|nr:DgyrCDS8696 [Dimorphilus gyrociliatus]
MVTVLPTVLYKLLCVLVADELEKFAKEFEDLVDDEGKFIGDLEIYRNRHIELCKLVESLDRVVSFITSSSFLSHITLLCIILYNVIYHKLNTEFTSLQLFWIFSIIIHMLTIGYHGGNIYVWAHHPIKSMLSLSLVYDGVDNDKLLQINMFMNKLTGTTIGVSAMGMFVVDPSALVTMFGVMITYFIILLQFRIGHKDFNCKCPLP